jgi:hypothetical protein
MALGHMCKPVLRSHKNGWIKTARGKMLVFTYGPATHNDSSTWLDTIGWHVWPYCRIKTLRGWYIEALITYLSFAFWTGFGWRCLPFAAKSPQQKKHHPPISTSFIHFHFIPFPDITIPELGRLRTGRPGQQRRAPPPSDSTSVSERTAEVIHGFQPGCQALVLLQPRLVSAIPGKHRNAEEVSERELLVISLSE